MPRSLANPLYERLLQSFPADQAYTEADLEEDVMPAPVRHFLVQLLRHHRNREARRLRRARTKWVDYDHPEMERAVQTFFSAVESHTQIPKDQWENTLHEAVHRTTAHLIRPVDVLTDFVYGEQTNPLDLQQVVWRMKFFGPFAYHRDAIRAFAQKQELDTLAPDQFERVLRRVDERITADFDADRWLQLLDALFLTARRATGDEQVNVRLLRTFFAQKEASQIAQHLTAYEQDGHDAIGPRALYRLIQKSHSTSPEREAAASSTRPPSTPERSSAAGSPGASAPSQPSPDPPAAPSPDDDIWGVAGSARPADSEADSPGFPQDESAEERPLWKQFQQGGTSHDIERRGTPQPENNQQPLWAQFRQKQSTPSPQQETTSPGNATAPSPSKKTTSPSEREPAPTDADLSTLEREVLGTSNPPHRAVYIRQLFNGDETAYRQVLGRLQTVDSWGEASQILARDVFRAYKVNIYSDAAVHFTNAIESRFRG